VVKKGYGKDKNNVGANQRWLLSTDVTACAQGTGKLDDLAGDCRNDASFSVAAAGVSCSYSIAGCHQ
jgi:hypothetical protein